MNISETSEYCPITRNILEKGNDSNGYPFIVSLPCKHCFDRKALIRWVLVNPSSSPTCPLCRTVFDSLLPFEKDI